MRFLKWLQRGYYYCTYRLWYYSGGWRTEEGFDVLAKWSNKNFAMLAQDIQNNRRLIAETNTKLYKLEERLHAHAPPFETLEEAKVAVQKYSDEAKRIWNSGIGSEVSNHAG